MKIQEIFAKNVREIRIEKGISQEKLALIAEVDRTYIQSIEKKHRNVSLSIANKIAIALNVDLCLLLKENLNEEK